MVPARMYKFTHLRQIHNETTRRNIFSAISPPETQRKSRFICRVGVIIKQCCRLVGRQSELQKKPHTALSLKPCKFYGYLPFVQRPFNLPRYVFPTHLERSKGLEGKRLLTRNACNKYDLRPVMRVGGDLSLNIFSAI